LGRRRRHKKKKKKKEKKKDNFYLGFVCADALGPL
jgi:hypothetical protein